MRLAAAALLFALSLLAVCRAPHGLLWKPRIVATEWGHLLCLGCLLLHGAGDELVFARQSARLAERLAELAVPHLDVRFSWATHGLDANLAGPVGQISTYCVERFLAAVTG